MLRLLLTALLLGVIPAADRVFAVAPPPVLPVQAAPPEQPPLPQSPMPPRPRRDCHQPPVTS
jgi:hypothetical protein